MAFATISCIFASVIGSSPFLAFLRCMSFALVGKPAEFAAFPESRIHREMHGRASDVMCRLAVESGGWMCARDECRIDATSAGNQMLTGGSSLLGRCGCLFLWAGPMEGHGSGRSAPCHPAGQSRIRWGSFDASHFRAPGTKSNETSMNLSRIIPRCGWESTFHPSRLLCLGAARFSGDICTSGRQLVR